jgi:hypothetical protein
LIKIINLMKAAEKKSGGGCCGGSQKNDKSGQKAMNVAGGAYSQGNKNYN